jgi:hypothetical protein
MGVDSFPDKAAPCFAFVCCTGCLPKTCSRLHEFDLLYTEYKELYAVICIFGTEYTINMGGPELEGYELWLKKNDYVSPLCV